MFCQNCGNQLGDGAKFCSHCGAATGSVSGNSPSQRKEEYVGVVKKCPSCGAMMQESDVVCRSCGYEITQGKMNAGLAQLFSSISEVESKRLFSNDIKNSMLDFFLHPTKAQDDSLMVDNKIATLISNFPVPSTKTDILEFFIHAATCVDVSSYKLSRIGDAAMKGKKIVSNAWLAKMEQVYKKAQISLSSDPVFATIEKTYTETNKKVATQKKLTLIFMILIAGSVLVFFLMPLFLVSSGY